MCRIFVGIVAKFVIFSAFQLINKQGRWQIDSQHIPHPPV